MNTGAIILTDNKDSFPKHRILFIPQTDWVIRAVKNAGIETICVVSEEMTEYSDTKVFSTLQQATGFINTEIIVVLSGDRPFIDADTIKSAIEMHKQNKNEKTVISDESIGYCINSDVIGKNGLKTEIYNSSNKNISLTAITGVEFLCLNNTMRNLIFEQLLNNGVDIPCTDGIIISPDCSIGKGTTIFPNTIIKGSVTIGENCIIGPNSYIENSKIGNGVKFNNSQIRNAKIMNNADIGPFVQVRPDAVIGDNVHLGNFVEVKNSIISEGTKVSHLTYVGDSDVGRNVNFGCGVVTVNFTGKTKHRTTIKDGAFIGCNTNLVAPVTVGENSYTAAGSTITDDVPDNSLAVARERQINKNGWVKKNQPYRNKV